MNLLTKKIKFFFPTALIVVVVFIWFFLLPSFVSSAQAAATSTIRGAAWWGDSVGYVYFNCLDDISGDQLDREGNLTDPGFRFFAPPCEYNQHKVVINPDGNLSGQAWNYNKGFISFSGTSTPPDGYGPTSSSLKCPNTCNVSNDCWSCYDEENKRLYGWAQVDSTGEWIRLDSDFPALDNKPPLQLETCAASPLISANTSGTPTSAILQPGDLFGVASSSVGDLFFNCKNEADSNACANKNNYHAYVSTLTIGALTAPKFTYAQACTGSGLGATLGWCVKSGQQRGYEIVVNLGTDFGPNPTPAQISGATCHILNNSETARSFPVHGNCPLVYNGHYYWWIRLYDENNEPTIWYQYYGNSIDDTDGNRDNNVKTFSTFKHKFPTPYFDLPEGVVEIGEDVELRATSSVYYTDAAPTTPQLCNDLACSYYWWSNSSYAAFSSTSSATTSVNFSQPSTSTTVSLQVTDLQPVDGQPLYYCIMTKKIDNINYGLPVWREVKAR